MGAKKMHLQNTKHRDDKEDNNNAFMYHLTIFSNPSDMMGNCAVLSVFS